MSPRSARQAEDLIERDYARLQPSVLASLRGKLQSQGLHVDAADLEGFYNQAWHALYSQLQAGKEIQNHSGFLVTVAYRRAIEDLRSHGDDHYHAEIPESASVEHDFSEELDDQARLRHLFAGMKERLSERERTAVALCYIHGYSRPEAATALGVSRKRIEKIMDGASRKLAQLTTDIDGDWCEQRRPLMTAFSLGILAKDGARYESAVDHLRDCSGCRRFVMTSRGLAAVIPPVGLPLLLVVPAAGVAGKAASGKATAGKTTGKRTRNQTIGVAAAVAAIAAAGAIAVVATNDDSSPSVPPPAAAATPPLPIASAVSAVQATASSAAKPARAAAQLQAKRARAKARAARKARETAAAAAVPVAVATPPPAAAPVTEPAPPTPAPAAEAPPAKEPVITDGAQEFGPEAQGP